MAPNFTKEDYQKIHNLAFQYKAGNMDAAIQILESFSWFIEKFLDFIMNETFNINDFTLRNFVGMFIADKSIRSQVNNYKKRYTVREQLYETSKVVSYLLSQYGYEEMKAEAIAVILEMAKCYKDTKPSFHNYVDKCFYKWFWWKTTKYFTDPVSKSLISYEDEFESDESIEDQFDKALEIADWHYTIKKFYESDVRLKPVICKNPYDNAIFDIAWIDGYTCCEPFKKLTSFERKILKLYYVDKLRDQDIGEQCGVCRATINRRRMAAQRKLEAIIHGQEEGNKDQDYNMQEVREGC
jgi:predicted DNA-binding protein (UPF0251 family)